MGGLVDLVKAMSLELSALETEDKELDTKKAENAERQVVLRRKIGEMVGEPEGGTIPRVNGTRSKATQFPSRPLREGGFIGRILDHMQSHPGTVFSPESIAEALGEPERNSLASTALRRLRKKELVTRLHQGAYLCPVEAGKPQGAKPKRRGRP